MKKIYICIIILFAILLTGCSKKISKIEVENITACIDIFNISDYQFTITYDDQTTETKAISLEMLNNEDQEKLYEIGTHEIVLNYEGKSTQFIIVLEERKAISIKAIPETIYSYVNEFEYEMISLYVEYNDKTSENLVFDKTHVSAEDAGLLKKAGTYDITIKIDDATTIVKFELIPNVIKIEELTQDIIIYNITKKVEDKYQSVFYALGNKEFSGFQFQIKLSQNVSDYLINNKHENIYVNDETLYVSFASSSNLNGQIELFTFEFDSTEQYRNFSINYDVRTLFVFIKNNKVEEIDNYLITLVR